MIYHWTIYLKTGIWIEIETGSDFRGILPIEEQWITDTRGDMFFTGMFRIVRLNGVDGI